MKSVSCCGTDCSACEYRTTLCGGCNETGGMPFHCETEPCSIYKCVILEKGLKNCAQCREVPCGIWQETRDPRFSDEAFAENIRQRLELLKKEEMV